MEGAEIMVQFTAELYYTTRGAQIPSLAATQRQAAYSSGKRLANDWSGLRQVKTAQR